MTEILQKLVLQQIKYSVFEKNIQLTQGKLGRTVIDTIGTAVSGPFLLFHRNVYYQ